MKIRLLDGRQEVLYDISHGLTWEFIEYLPEMYRRIVVHSPLFLIDWMNGIYYPITTRKYWYLVKCFFSYYLFYMPAMKLKIWWVPIQGNYLSTGRLVWPSEYRRLEEQRRKVTQAMYRIREFNKRYSGLAREAAYLILNEMQREQEKV